MILTPGVLHLLGRQHGVASNTQLLQHLSARQLKRASIQGQFVSELRGVKRLAGAVEDIASRIVALSLFAGNDGFVSGMAAARQLGVECVPRNHLELMLADRRDPDLPPWVRLTRSSWRIADDRRELSDGRVVACPLRALFRCGAVCPAVRFEKIAEQMWNRGLITPNEAASYLGDVRRQGRHGVSRFVQWLEHAATRERPSQSGLEVDLVHAVMRAGLPAPQRQLPLLLPNGELIHLDAAWPDIRLGLEPGATWWHSGDGKGRSDKARDWACDDLGWRIMRFDEVELRDLGSCAQRVVAVHRQRSATRLQQFAPLGAP